ncbi:MAG: 1-(5-phosphoribosyl)-5-[(5-phosphoribosylamino)methylideneamino]imidazole-4-carboxamide isomerase [Spirochaetes bacterium]|nr:MAG: 1-(5-phosphoribosyl)-5-[(5-phosphoribosylamino)methylideneamino]imidazole-4-carboxamide isomerase [Spirochaetota bacterium]
MLVIPAIDLRNGKCVRLIQGDPERMTVYSDDPVEMARRFQDMGARLIHVVDLDGAFEGKPVNDALVVRMAAAVKVPLEIGGGIRNAQAIRRYADAGIGRIIMGSVVLDPGFGELLTEFGKYIVAGVDARDSMVAVHGWKTVSGVKAFNFINMLKNSGLDEIIYTDISTDGMLSGPNIAAMRRILEDVPGIRLVASGGVSSMTDIENLAELEPMGLIGCIVGKAYYDGRVDLKEACARFA